MNRDNFALAVLWDRYIIFCFMLYNIDSEKYNTYYKNKMVLEGENHK